MSQTSGPAGDQVGRPASLTARGRALLGDRLFKYGSIASALLVFAILVLILITTLHLAWPAFDLMGFGVLTNPTWHPNDTPPIFGGLGYIFGTAYVAVIALVIAIPVSIAIGLFITEFAPRRTRGFVITIIDLLAAVPSVVFGLWGIIVFVPWVTPIYNWVNRVLGPIPVLGSIFGPNTAGRNFFSAGLIVAVMIVPIITSITREVFATVPSDHKQAALALGATRWEMIKGAVLPHSFGGVTGAVMLGLGRALGETIAVALVVGSAPNISVNVFSPGYTIPSAIANLWQGEGGNLYHSALLSLGVVLFLFTIVVNYVARIVVRRAEIRMRGAAA